MMLIQQRLVLIFLCTFRFALGGTKFSISDSGVQCSGGDFQVNSLSISCGETYCTFGSSVEASGTATISNTLATDTPTVTVRFANMVNVVSDKAVDVCGHLSSSSGSTCPDAGSYDIEAFNFQIPGDAEDWYTNYVGWMNSVSMKVIFNFGGTTTTCKTTLTLTKTSGYTMVAGAVVVFSLAGVLTTIGRKRRAAIQLDEEEGTPSHFEMLPNEGAVRV